MPTFIINKGQSNNICPTLVEKTTLSPVFYLLEVTSETTGQSVYCIPTETSTELQRYNEFIITETANPVPLNGEISLNEGRYMYKFYEQSSSTNLNPSGLTEVENGIIICVDNTNHLNTEYTSITTNTEYQP